MALTVLECKQARAKTKSYKLTDGDGMYLLVLPSGGKYWRFDYKFEKKRKTLAIGPYEKVGLAQAREKLASAKAQLAQGIDPMAKEALQGPREASEAVTFKQVALEWHDNRTPTWTPRYSLQVRSVLDRDLIPDLGALPFAAITPKDLLSSLRKIEARDALDALNDAVGFVGQIYRYAIATDKVERDVSADIKGAFRPHKSKNHKFLIPDALPAFLAALDQKNPSDMSVVGVKLVLLTLVRTTELRAAKWAEFDLEEATWLIPEGRMKMRRPHIVPLSRQAVKVLREWHKVTGAGEYVFPNQSVKKKKKHEFMSENTMLNLIADMGYKEETTVHGLRSLGSTVLHENEEFDSLAIERQLAHVDRNNVRRTYNHAQYLDKRKVMMQWWADYLDKALKSAKKPTPRSRGKSASP